MEVLFDNSITQNKQSQSLITPELAQQILEDGNHRFTDGNFLHRDLGSQIHETSTGQYPFAAVLSCIDSRIPTEIVFDQGIGDIFNARIAGNFVNEDILGSLEFACKLAGSKIIVVMGHTSCGAVKGACDHAKLGNLTQMLDKIKPAIDSIPAESHDDRSSANLEFVNEVARKNVQLTIDKIKSDSEVLNELSENGEIKIVGAMYHVENGKVEFFG